MLHRVYLAEGINIKDIEVLKVREGEGGTIRMGFGQQEEAERSVDICEMRVIKCGCVRESSMYEVKEARGLIGECDVPGDAETTLYLLGVAAMLSQSDLTLHCVGDDWKTRRALDLLRRLNAQLDIQVTRSKAKVTRTIKVQGSELRRTRIGGEQTDLFIREVPFLAVRVRRPRAKRLFEMERACDRGRSTACHW